MTIEREEIFGEVAEAILAHLELEEVLKAILVKALEFFKSDAASVMLFDRHREVLTIAASIGLDPDYVKLVKVAKGEEVAGRVIEEGKIRVIPNILEVFNRLDDRFTHEKVKAEGLYSMICAPVIAKVEALGCVNIYYRQQHDFDPDEVKTISFFCNLAAIAIENAKFYKETRDRLQDVVELSDIGRTINSLRNIEEIIHSVLSTATYLVGAQGCSIVMLKNGGPEVDRAYQFNRSMHAVQPCAPGDLIAGGLIEKVMASRQPVTIPDRSDSTPALWGAYSVCAIPLRVKDRLIGIVAVSDRVPREFTERDSSLLVFLANESAVAIENARLNEDIERRMKELYILHEIGQGLMSTLELDSLFTDTLHRLKETMGYVNCAILFVDDARQELYFRSAIGYPVEVTKLRLKIGEGVTGYAVQTGQVVYVPDVTSDRHYVVGMQETRSELSVPLEIGRKVIGVLDIESTTVNGFSHSEISLFKSIAAQLSMAIEKSMLYEETKSLSLTDPLTEVANRRQFTIILDAEIKRSERYGRPLSLIIVDLDHFKEYNDHFGHPAGDRVLRQFAQMMQKEIRDIDFMARYGGDEFIFVLPETDVLFARLVAERIRQRIEANPVDPSITVSLGIASFPKDARDRDALVGAADRALYEAKQLGGNRIALVD